MKCRLNIARSGGVGCSLALVFFRNATIATFATRHVFDGLLALVGDGNGPLAGGTCGEGGVSHRNGKPVHLRNPTNAIFGDAV